MRSEPPAPKLPEPAKKAQDYAAVRDWPGYYRVVQGKPAREATVDALDRFEREGSRGIEVGAAPTSMARARRAIDLGSGEGRDALEMLRRGWRVLAIDDHPEAARLLLERVPPEQRGLLEMRVAGFGSMDWTDVDLVNSSYSLPFCSPAEFPEVWAKIVASIRRGGRFAGQLFGNRDTWAALPDRAHQTEAEARSLLAGFDVELFKVEERDDADALGKPKHWHIFQIVARKK